MKAPRAVVIFGIESTGKTRLAEALAARFDEPWAPEYVREFWEARSGVITASDLGAIARGQMANEDAAAARARRVYFCDTDLVTCTLWDDVLFPGACPAWVRAEAERRARAAALYLWCEADVPFAPDPQRCFPDAAARAGARERWRAALTGRGLPWIGVTGGWAERERAAVAAVARVLSEEGRDGVRR